MLKKTAATLALAAALPLAATTSASAKDVEGRFGIGAQHEAGGGSGLNLRYWLSHFGLQATIGAGYVGDNDATPADDSAFNLGLSLRGLFNFARANDTNLYAGGGLSLGLIDADSTVVDLVLGVEHFFTDHFSVGGQVGMHIDVGADTLTMNLGGTGASWGSAFHFYF
jgi:hypothetical protein